MPNPESEESKIGASRDLTVNSDIVESDEYLQQITGGKYGVEYGRGRVDVGQR